MDIIYDKKILRKKAKEFRLSLTNNEILRNSKEIHQKFMTVPEFKDADIILMYASLPGEIETITLANHLLANGKKIFFPRTQDARMQFYRIESTEHLYEGNFHVLEPVASDDKLFIPDPKQSVCMILPGLMFDQSGNRLGYGKGFYDKYLASLQDDLRLTKIAFSYDEMLLNKIPSEPTDQKTDYIITEKQIYCIS